MRRIKIGDFVKKKFPGGIRIGEVTKIINDKEFPNSSTFYKCQVLWKWQNGEVMTDLKYTTSQAYSLKLTEPPK